MIKWKNYQEGKGIFAKHTADSKLGCSCKSMLFTVRQTEDGDIYVQCSNCGLRETIQYN